MDCLYAPELLEDSIYISINQDEVKHAKALRLKIGERVLLSSGKGLIALCTVQSINHQQAVFSIHEIRKKIHELPGRFAIAIGIFLLGEDSYHNNGYVVCGKKSKSSEIDYTKNVNGYLFLKKNYWA